ncbi:MAG: CpsD/CapB family tyrosine-protein kinase [Anaerolineae bacterium]|nr:CpsD/CapB family tyrosine-protein kinase [Anaerolineae bacterium]MCB0205031.1 CpsD/CapB family tyrosine-protein kinase [Anaerolineae bacterium]MCB0256143.1 CpsD/CapB family tyrosine-protein kinase [Anaerolineae bacterium]
MTKQLATLTDPRSPAAEAYRSLYINLSFSSQERPVRSLLVVSPGPDEDKSETLANLAIVAAQMGQQVVVVDCDLRQPRLHELFNLRNDAGVATVIAEKSEAARALQAVTEVPGLKVLTSGPLPVSPTQVLASRSMETLLHDLVESADLVLIDAPPVVAVSDASVLAAKVDGVLLVLKAGQTKRDYARQAKETLEKVNAHIVGAVLNNVAADAAMQRY